MGLLNSRIKYFALSRGTDTFLAVTLRFCSLRISMCLWEALPVRQPHLADCPPSAGLLGLKLPGPPAGHTSHVTTCFPGCGSLPCTTSPSMWKRAGLSFPTAELRPKVIFNKTFQKLFTLKKQTKKSCSKSLQPGLLLKAKVKFLSGTVAVASSPARLLVCSFPPGFRPQPPEPTL